MSFKLKIEIFEGPLDLLLYLVKKDHLNIYDIPISEVTAQYLQYLELMRLLDLSIAGEFLVMASTLMHIKSKMLLPAEESQAAEEEEDPRAELVRQLLEYEKFKEIAQNLKQKEADRQEVFKRPKSGAPPDVKDDEGGYFEASLFDLIAAFSKALGEVPKELFYEVIKDEFTIEEKIHYILHLLLLKSHVKLSELFSQAKNKLEVIVIFLSILELIRLKEVVFRQKEVFGEIEVSRNAKNIVPYGRQDKAETN